MKDTELIVWLTLLGTPGIGLKTARNLMHGVKDVDEFMLFDILDFRERGLTAELAGRVKQSFTNCHGEETAHRLQHSRVKVVGENDGNYPALLRHIADPPPFLTYLGTGVAKEDTIVAIVGTRSCTAYGRKVAIEAAQDLSRQGVIVASGLAIGIDQAAHTGVLQSAGNTIAVLGSGLHEVYPPENRNLAKQILASGGTLYSEFLPWQGPERHRFVQRNRVISGMSRAVIIVEAGEKSGALITADFALSQNRDVAVVPGSIYTSKAQGCHALLAQGALPLLSTRGVLQQLQISIAKTVTAATCGNLDKPSVRDERIKQILAHLQLGSASIDDLKRVKSLQDLSVAELSGILTRMEIDGLLMRIGPGLYGV